MAVASSLVSNVCDRSAQWTGTATCAPRTPHAFECPHSMRESAASNGAMRPYKQVMPCRVLAAH
eukprot:446620-Amphidinium_carterae.1